MTFMVLVQETETEFLASTILTAPSTTVPVSKNSSALSEQFVRYELLQLGEKWA